ncbi:MAG: hypothetical protein HQK52_21655 [Oligoflexia bacterium]|nr:hypothetical protein [Oligoflexia bacterium]
MSLLGHAKQIQDKNLSNFTSIEKNFLSTTAEGTLEYDAVYIDDEKIFRIGWASSAKKAGVRLLTLSNPQELEMYEAVLSKEDCVIYIDQELGPRYPKGDLVAISLFKKGFKKIKMATCYNSGIFEQLKWLECTGKTPPWN